MGRIRGFLLKHKFTVFFRGVFRRRRSTAAYRRLNPPRSFLPKSISSLISWIGSKAKAIAPKKVDSSYIRVGQDPVRENPVHIPKGHLAVYVGQKDGEIQRIMVPVVYFNHPLFGDLLKESEREYGYNHPGGITIPCGVSEFERVQTRIKCTQKMLTWKRSK